MENNAPAPDSLTALATEVELIPLEKPYDFEAPSLPPLSTGS